jgi:hypothetical protein
MTPVQLSLISKEQFIARLQSAVSTSSGFAAGKIGESEKRWMYQPIVRAECSRRSQLRAFELSLKFHAFNQSALFPPEVEFYSRYNEFYISHIRKLDALGLFRVPSEAQLVHHYGLDIPMIAYEDQRPDVSIPHNPALCYLQFFRGKRILIVTSPAEFLAARATKEIFEAVWHNTGKRWFYPASVDALSFPFGWAPDVMKRYGNSIHLFENVVESMAQRKFDVALIAAGGLGIPLASAAKQLGKVGLSLGGHLQILFGVLGRRWRVRGDWIRNYVNPSWTDMPDPSAGWTVPGGDFGAYW